jgi:uncharacterized protein (TIRG00374 family)
MLSRRLRQIVSLLLKFLFAAAVLTWMIRSGKLDPRRVAAAFTDWPRTAAIVAMIYLQIMICAWRWLRLTNTLGFRLRFRDAFSLTMIGVMFSTIVPGSVGGDVMKAYYAGAHVPNRRVHAFTTILIDRYVGLLGLLTLAAIAVAANWSAMLSNRVLLAVGGFAAAAFCTGIVALAAGVFVSGTVEARIARFRLPLAGIVVKCLNALGEYRRAPGAIVGGVLVSLPAHLLACFGIYLAIAAMRSAPPPLFVFLLLVPLGLMTTVIPVSPGGIGIGQAAMFTLFEAVRPGTGATVSDGFTVYQTLQIAVFLTGFIPYVAFKAARPVAVEASVG